MATMYFRPAAGNWSAAGTWSNSSGGASNGLVPDATTDCILDAGSGANTLTIDGTSGSPNLCRSLVCTGFTGTLGHASAKQLNIGDGTAGAFTLVSGMTYNPAGDSLLKFVSTTTGNNITFGSKSMGNMTFDGVGGTWTFQSAPATGNATTITLTNGNLNVNGNNLNTYIISSSNSNTRSLTMGTMTWTVGSGNSGTFWEMSNSSGMTLSAANCTQTISTTSTNITLNLGGLTYGTLQQTALTTGTTTINGANTFGTLTLSMAGTTKTTLSGYSLGGNQTVTGTFTAAGNSAILRNYIRSDTIGTPRTISAGTFTVTHTDLRDITKAGAGSGDFSALTTNANGDAGGNTGFTFTAPKNCYLKVNANANWSASNWYTTSGGSTAIVPAVPLIHDTAIIDANASFSTSRTITNSDQPRMPAMNWTGAPNTPAFASGSSAWEHYGSMTLISGMTHTGSGTMSFCGRGAFTLDGGGLTWPTSSAITVNCASGNSLSLGSNFASNSTISVTSGNFKNLSYTGSFTGITVNGGTLTLGSSGLTTSGAQVLAQSGTISGNGYYVTTSTGQITFAGAAAGAACNPLGGYIG